MRKIYFLRTIHGLASLYFMVCLIYIYYAAVIYRLDFLLFTAITSLAIVGGLIFIFNKGDWPLIHIQKKLGDNKPFFELIFPPKLAKQAISFFAFLCWLGLGLLVIRTCIIFLS